MRISIVSLLICPVTFAASTYPRLAPELVALEHNNSTILIERSTAGTQLPKGISEHFFDQKLDHNDPKTTTFKQRYWISNRYYSPGGPIIAYLAEQDNGETDIDFLDFGVVDTIAKKTKGLAVMLEHRYYGASVPTPDLSTVNLRWLTMDQSLKDIIYFSKTANFGYGTATISTKAPWIYYGGGYSGSQAAFLRVTYPDEVFGAIASSATVHSEVDFWEYWENIRANGGQCTASIVEVVDYLDNLHEAGEHAKVDAIKKQFGLQDLVDYRDFMWVLSHVLERWRDQKWYDPKAARGWPKFCNTLAAGIRSNDSRAVRLNKLIANYARYVFGYYVVPALKTGRKNVIVEWHSPAKVPPKHLTKQQFDLTQTWRPYLYQKCTELGQHSAAAPAGHPSLFSRSIDVAYISLYCTTQFSDSPSLIPKVPRIENINKFGGFDISAPRLAFIDGARDPWLYATVHSSYASKKRRNEHGEQAVLIPDGYHISDQYGIDPRNGNKSAIEMPMSIKAVRGIEVELVKAWVKEWPKAT